MADLHPLIQIAMILIVLGWMLAASLVLYMVIDWYTGWRRR